MKKITMLVFLSFCAIGFSQNSQDQNKEIKAPTVLTVQSAKLPAAYFNNSATTQGENAGVANNGQRNTNVTVPFTGTHYSNRPDAMIYDNGPFWNVAGTPNVSLLESATLGMNTLGSGAQFTAGNSVADDVVFAEDVEITSIDVFAYQTGSNPPSVTAIYLQVWDDDPSGGGANVIWGDLVTDIFDDAVYADANRASETSPTDTSRKIQRVTALTTGLTLPAGTYWIEYTFEGSGSSGPWTPPIAILGETTTGNALQNQNGTWVALEDGGTFTPQGLPFVIYGEIVGGGGTEPCDQSHGVPGDANGGSGSSMDSDYKSAVDIVVPLGEDFRMDTILVSFLTFAPEDAPTTAQVVYYADAAGLPGTEIGSEIVFPTILSSAEWVNPVAWIFETQLDLTPFVFNGDAGTDTTYWVEISMGTATNQATVFWIYTDGAGLEGEPLAQFNAADGFWSVPEPTREGIYIFSGECRPMLSVVDNMLGGFTYYPNPTTGSLSLQSVNNIDSVSFYNLLGQKVMDVNVNATTSEINLSGLNTGTYIMKVSVEGQIGTYKVLKN